MRSSSSRRRTTSQSGCAPPADNWLGNWEKAVTKQRHNLSTVVLDSELKAEIVADAKKFIEEPMEYCTTLGSYRRGYLPLLWPSAW